MKQRLYDPEEPFPILRPYQDSVQSVDHFFAKLLGLASTMQTDHGREIAMHRTAFMLQFLHELADEIGVDDRDIAVLFGDHLFAVAVALHHRLGHQ